MCEHAQEMLNGLQVKHDLRINRVDIDSNDELYEMYRFDIPVFEFRDGSSLHGRIKKKNFLNKLETNRE